MKTTWLLFGQLSSNCKVAYMLRNFKLNIYKIPSSPLTPLKSREDYRSAPWVLLSIATQSTGTNATKVLVTSGFLINWKFLLMLYTFTRLVSPIPE
jgi:hypothetical protein